MTTDSLDQRLPAARADRVPRGILYMLSATVMFAVSMAIAKWQVASYSFAEVLFFRAVGSLAVCAVLILPRTGIDCVRARSACAITSAAAARRRWRRASSSSPFR